jgi:hypothetical protein
MYQNERANECGASKMVWSAILNVTDLDLERLVDEVAKIQSFIVSKGSYDEVFESLPSLAFIASNSHTESEILEQEAYLCEEEMSAVRARHMIHKIESGLEVDASDTTAQQQRTLSLQEKIDAKKIAKDEKKAEDAAADDEERKPEAETIATTQKDTTAEQPNAVEGDAANPSSTVIHQQAWAQCQRAWEQQRWSAASTQRWQ